MPPVQIAPCNGGQKVRTSPDATERCSRVSETRASCADLNTNAQRASTSSNRGSRVSTSSNRGSISSIADRSSSLVGGTLQRLKGACEDLVRTPTSHKQLIQSGRRMSRRSTKGSCSDATGDTLTFFKPNVVQRVRLMHAAHSSWMVRSWLALDSRASRIGALWTQMITVIMLASYGVYAARSTTTDSGLHRAQFGLEAVIACDWLFRVMLAFQLDIVPRVRAHHRKLTKGRSGSINLTGAAHQRRGGIA